MNAGVREEERKRGKEAGQWIKAVGWMSSEGNEGFWVFLDPDPGGGDEGVRPAQNWEAVNESHGRCGNTEKRNAAIGEGQLERRGF